MKEQHRRVRERVLKGLLFISCHFDSLASLQPFRPLHRLGVSARSSVLFTRRSGTLHFHATLVSPSETGERLCVVGGDAWPE